MNRNSRRGEKQRQKSRAVEALFRVARRRCDTINNVSPAQRKSSLPLSAARQKKNRVLKFFVSSTKRARVLGRVPKPCLRACIPPSRDESSLPWRALLLQISTWIRISFRP